MRIAFIGLGNMGAPMAGRLIAEGFDLRVYDTNPALGGRFGSVFASSAASAARDAELIVTMLPNGDIVREVLLGIEGALHAAAPGAIVLDTSSSDAAGTVALGAELKALGFGMVDAPVSGGVPMAAAGTLSLMVGTDDDGALDRCRPILEKLGVRIVRMGTLGSGHATKAINNAIAATTLAATSEGLVLGAAFGIDPALLLETINASTGRSAVSESVFKTQIVPRTFAQGFSLGLMAKDVGLADVLRTRLQLELPTLAHTRKLWDDARDALGASADFTAYFLHAENTSGAPHSSRERAS